MSVMAETHQSAMGPYFTMAAVGLVSKAWTAVFREALVVKVFVKVQAGGESDGGSGGGGGGGSDGDDGGGGDARGLAGASTKVSSKLGPSPSPRLQPDHS